MSSSAAVRLNAWAFVAIVTVNLGRWCLHHSDLSPAGRALVALAPLVPSCLYVLDLARWVRGLDELQQRIQRAAWLCATTGAVLVLLAAELLRGAGVGPGFRLGWEGTFVLTFGLYLVGSAINTRRMT